MRISPEGFQAAWPGDMPNQCDLGYNCPSPSLVLDSFDVFGSRYVEVGAGGPNPFTFTATSDASWLSISPNSGSVSPEEPETRVFFTVQDWDAIQGNATAKVTFTANADGQKPASFAVDIVAVHNTVPDDFQGFVQGAGVVSIEAAHAVRNTSVSGVTWAELPGLGRTESGVTPWPRMGNNGQNFTLGEGPSIEYDFYTFSTGANGTILVSAHISPIFNSQGKGRPIGVGFQVDDEPAQSNYFVPPTAPGKDLPTGWVSYIGEAIMTVNSTFTAAPGAHNLKIWMIEPAVVVQKIVIDAGGLKQSFLGPPESVRV